MARLNFGTRVSALAALLVGTAVACGSSGSSLGPLPPIITTTTTTTLLITTSTAPREYQIQKGDTLGKIAKRFGITIRELKLMNGINNANHIEVGQTLTIPRPGEIKLPATTTSPATSVPDTAPPPVAGGSTTFVP